MQFLSAADTFMMVHTFDIIQLAIVAFSTFLFCVSILVKILITRKRLAILGTMHIMMTIITLAAAVIKIILTFSLEED